MGVVWRRYFRKLNMFLLHEENEDEIVCLSCNGLEIRCLSHIRVYYIEGAKL